MPDPTEQNPFVGLPLAELDRACVALLAEIDSSEPRKLDERAVLISRVRDLVVAVTAVVNPGLHASRSPESTMAASKSTSLYSAYVAWHRAEASASARALRLRTVKRAADWVLGDKANTWLEPGASPMDSWPRNRAVDTEDGLRDVLKELDTIYAARRR